MTEPKKTFPAANSESSIFDQIKLSSQISILRPTTCVLILAALALITGCQKLNPFAKSDSSPARWASHPTAIFLSQDMAANAKAVPDIQAAFDFWENKAGKKLFSYQGIWKDAIPPIDGTIDDPSDIKGNVIFTASSGIDWGSETAGRTILLKDKSEIKGAMVVIHQGLDFCYGTCTGMPTTSVSFRRLITHELGHFLGLDHSNDTGNIMYPILRPDAAIDQASYDNTALQSALEPFD